MFGRGYLFRQPRPVAVIMVGLVLSAIVLIPTATFGEPLRIMPLGNSITKGVSGSDLDIGYRRKLYLDLTNSAYNVDFVGTQVHGLVDDFDRDHEGHGGWEADEIRDNIYGWLVLNPADYVLLHIGTNDISHNNIDINEIDQLLDNIDQFEVDYGNPIVVLLAKIIHRDDGLNYKTIAYNDSIEMLAATRIANGDDIILVNMDTALIYPDDLNDAVHPNQTGYDKMATTWYNYLVGILPFGKCPDSMSHYWRLDEASGPAYEDSWAASDAYCVDCPSSVEGVINSAQHFRVPEVLDVPSNNSFDWDVDESFSIELWFRLDECLDTDPDNRQVLIGRMGDGETLYRWWLAINCSPLYPSGRLEFNLEDTSDGLLLTGADAVVDGDWHHVLAVRDGDLDSNILFLDGNWIASGHVEYVSGFVAESDITIGYHQDTSFSSYCSCYIDEIATYSRALSSLEANSHFNAGAVGHPYCDGAISPSITSVPEESAYEGEVYEYALTATGDPEPRFELGVKPSGMTIDSLTGLIEWLVESAGDYQVQAFATNTAGSDTQDFVISVASPPACPPGLSHYWKLDEQMGPTYYDFYGTADAVGTSLDPSDGIVDGAQLFSRDQGDGLDVFQTAEFDWGPESSFSIEFWLKKETGCLSDDNSSNNIVMGRYDGSPGSSALNLWWIGVNCRSSEGVQGGIRFVLRDDLNTGVSLVGGTDVIDGEWHHVVAVRDGTLDENRVYVDGDLDAATSYVYTGGFVDDSPANIGYIGFGGFFRLDGYLDELALHTRVLNETKIEDRYMSGLNGIGVCPEFVCGDANGSGAVDIDDAVFLISYIFSGGPAPVPLISGDVNCSGAPDIDDAVYIITWIFGGGSEPCSDCP